MNVRELKSLPFFSGISDAEFDVLSGLFQRREFEGGQTIFNEGDVSDTFYLITRGTVDILKATSSGREKLIANLGPGDFFGEMALFDEGARSAAAVAKERTEAAAMPGEKVKRLFGSGAVAAAKLMLNILRVVSKRIRKTDSELTVLYETGMIIGSTSDLNVLLSEVLNVVVASLDAASGIVFLKNDVTNEFDVRAVAGEKELASGSYNTYDGLLGEVNRLKMAISVRKLSESPLYSQLEPCGYESDSMLAAPLIAGDRLLGAVLLGGRAFDRSDEGLLTAVGNMVSVAIANILSQQEVLSKQKLSRRYFHL